ncbi:5-deoxy-glucuronate isomerase [Alkalibacter mobilis]|uniref:5-deoxy-glucuronate isomerase n=1 Tax=Alkalibacter mobilis TaxID=2787712 RepID=UPI00189CCCAB|nr:5-deoxy-glucuronate isomerase [Alkalibacter mobilis]MBF7096737.1 5-deoxy-glucuronate isomerase [Alkalibacter mobilis]
MKKYTEVFRFKNIDGYERVITRNNSDCEFLGFDRILIKKGQTLEHEVVGEEIAIVLQEGEYTADVYWNGKKVLDGVTGKRKDVYSDLPTTLYLPPNSKLIMKSETGLEARVFTTPCSEGNPPFQSLPCDVEEGDPGHYNWRRKYRWIFGPQGKNMDHVTKKLLVGESVSIPGGWIGFPAHKHDLDNEKEFPLDEIFSIRVKGPHGKYVIQHSYGLEGDEGGAWDEFNKISDDETAIALPFGYHTSLAVPGCTEYLLWGLAGNDKVYKLLHDERFQWLSDVETLREF